MPAAAVIPALLVYAKVAAVKTLLFGDWESVRHPAFAVCVVCLLLRGYFGARAGYHD